MKRCLLHLVVALATIPSISALPTGEFTIAPSGRGLAPFDRRNLKVAANEETALAVWEDFRVDPSQPPRIWASRVKRADGTVLDPTGISLAALPALSGSALQSVATDGKDFLVVWTEGTRVRFAQIPSSGPPVIATDPGINAVNASVSFIGDSYAVVYTPPAISGLLPATMEVAVVSKTGAVTHRTGAVYTGNAILNVVTTVAGNNNFVFVTWTDGVDSSNVRAGALFTGQLRDGTPKMISIGSETPGSHPRLLSIASDNTNMFVSWFDVTGTPAAPAYHARLFDGNGTPITAESIVAQAPEDPPSIASTWDGGGYMLLFRATDRSISAVRYLNNGTREDATPFTVILPNVSGVAATGLPKLGEIFLAWLPTLNTGSQVAADYINNHGPNLRFAPLNLSLSGSFVHRSDAAVAWVGDHFLAAWQDNSNVSRTLIARFSADGVPLDGTGIDVSRGVATSVPVMASNGKTALLAWHEFDGVTAWIVDEQGNLQRRMFGFPGGLPSVNWNGQQYVVMWRSTDGQLLGIRLTAAGALIDASPITIAPVTGDPMIAWTGNSYVAVFPEFAPLPIVPPPTTLWAQLVSAGLTAIGSRIQLSEGQVVLPVAVGDGPAGALVVWKRVVGQPLQPPQSSPPDAPSSLEPPVPLVGARIVNGAIIDPLNGFFIGLGRNPTVYGTADGWGVVDGPFLWLVSRSGGVSQRFAEFPFVPVGARATVVTGGPAPLVVYRRPPIGNEQMLQLVGHYLIGRRERAARH